ncbi:TPA: hypothetical protein N0F65_006844 [Lagenidium giganteum]|uniref:Sugar phosphate transporter domain-containing protein n=1 Tax=Lagenidium giganteum TaxID=4803 RepID=A0AAV2ZHE4_9STRA|nr:TPA: hypothetical protein N0F65_006844 [Lagenidium giganteum]
MVRTATCLVVWYLFSTASTFTNKNLIKHHHVSAEMLTLSHLFVSVVCDFALLTLPVASRTSSWRMQTISPKRIAWLMPLSLLSVFAKVLTYWSYDAVPVAVAHTCKASQPFFNVLMAYAVYRSKFSLATYLSLVPIVVGVIMASVSEMGMNNLAVSGIAFAVISALLGVVQSMYAKFLLRSRVMQDSINLHFYSAFLSFAINTPVVMYSSFQADKMPNGGPFPYVTVLFCSLMYFVGSFCSSMVLGDVTELTYSIMGTMKRVVIIVSAIIYFGNPVTIQSVTGMILAIGGVGAYQLIRLQTKQVAMPLPRTLTDVHQL